jgi:hypothetical protein
MKTIYMVILLLGLGLSEAHAAHPLITDDTGTQGKRKAQFEVVGEYEHVNKDGVTTDTLVVPTVPVLSYGITDATDIVLGVSYLHVRTSNAGNTTTADGVSDVSVELKWRFYEKDGLSFALKPGITLPTGSDQKGLGAGRMTYHLFFITTKEVKPWAFHFNLGYIRNENTLDERKGLWHASFAGALDVAKDLKAVANIGIQRNEVKDSNTNPAFVLGGLIYSISKSIDLDIGLKRGLNHPGTDYSVLAGMIWRF